MLYEVVKNHQLCITFLYRFFIVGEQLFNYCCMDRLPNAAWPGCDGAPSPFERSHFTDGCTTWRHTVLVPILKLTRNRFIEDDYVQMTCIVYVTRTGHRHRTWLLLVKLSCTTFPLKQLVEMQWLFWPSGILHIPGDDHEILHCDARSNAQIAFPFPPPQIDPTFFYSATYCSTLVQAFIKDTFVFERKRIVLLKKTIIVVAVFVQEQNITYWQSTNHTFLR